jgi:ABC-2 type transport system permease protein
MRTLRLVIWHELKSTASKRSFWLMTLLFPLLITAISLGPQLLARQSVEDELQDPSAAATDGTQPLGYVDGAGIIRQLPPDLNAGALRPYADETAARAAVSAQEISGYFLVPADYLRSGSAVLVTPELSLLSAGQRSGQLDYVLRYNLAGDATLASLLRDPTPAVVATSLEPAPSAAENARRGPAASFLPIAVMFILFFVITMSASYMLQSVVKEKENRTAEVLLVSLHPRDLMLGKVIGLGFLALGQMAIWLVGGMLLTGTGLGLAGLLRNPQASAAVAQGAAPAGMGLPPGFALWALLFFLGGYVVYSSALGALGALAPNMREGSQFTFVFLIPLLTPVWLNYVFTQQPHGSLATILSLFPLTAPTAMVARLAAGGVPFWQAAVSLVGLAVTAYIFINLAARFFRADTLLSSGSLSWRRIASELHPKDS